MLVPLAAHGRTLGVLTFVAAESGHHYDAVDLAFAEDLARRAATAIDNARLYHEAREANRIKDEFLATLSHELRTPMTAILGWTHLLKTGALDHEAKIRAIDTIDRNARSQTQIIEDILDVSRIITGKIRLDLHPLELGPVIQSAVESIRPSAEAKNISIESDIDLNAGKISGSVDRLQQVVWNLLSNAIKFTPRDGRVKVRLRRDAAAGVELCIADTGVGISREFLPYVFDRFRQADGSTTRQHGGLGLGLSIVRQLVDLHGGTIRAESEGPGEGAVFTIHLPFVSGTREIENRKEHKEGKVYTSNVLKAARILIVENEPDARALLEMALKRNGAEVKSAADVKEAMEAIKAWRPEIVLSDLGMPTEDGYALIRQIRALPPENGGAIPSAALTAYAREEDRQRAIAAGFDMHIAKPVSVNELISAVSTLRAMKNDTLKPA
jgi:signal transduction histidine kinase/ActR/RegA family two-component response regulator